MSNGRLYKPSDPSYYKSFFGLDAENTPYEAELQDCNYGEFIQIYGHRCDIYLCSQYNPSPVFGEDPVKEYKYAPFLANGIWDLTTETLNMGQFGKNTDQESVIIYFHKNTVKTSIRKILNDEGFLGEDEEPTSKYDRHRLELQEGDIFRMYFNNIFYEIDGIKEEPEYQHHLWKYVYEVHARPRLISAEDLGDMQPVTDSDEIRNEHEEDLQIEADKILF